MNTIHIEFPSLSENIRVVESFIDNAKEKFNLNDDIYGNIMVAVTESVSNAITHGNKNDKDKAFCYHGWVLTHHHRKEIHGNSHLRRLRGSLRAFGWIAAQHGTTSGVWTEQRKVPRGQSLDVFFP